MQILLKHGRETQTGNIKQQVVASARKEASAVGLQVSGAVDFAKVRALLAAPQKQIADAEDAPALLKKGIEVH